MGWKDISENSNLEPQKAQASQTQWTRVAIVVPWLLSIAAILFGVVQFTVQQKAGNRRPFLEKQLTVTFEAADAAATLATTSDKLEWKKARDKFMRLKFGPLRIVEDRALSQAMSEFWERLPSEDDPNLRLPLRRLEQRALKIAEVSRSLIGTSWNVELEPIVEGAP